MALSSSAATSAYGPHEFFLVLSLGHLRTDLADFLGWPPFHPLLGAGWPGGKWILCIEESMLSAEALSSWSHRKTKTGINSYINFATRKIKTEINSYIIFATPKLL